MIIQDEFVLKLRCDDLAHGPGDLAADAAFAGAARTDAYARATRAGWRVAAATGAVRCPRHVAVAVGEDRPATVRGRLVAELQDAARARAVATAPHPGAAADEDDAPGLRSRAAAARAAGALALFVEARLAREHALGDTGGAVSPIGRRPSHLVTPAAGLAHAVGSLLVHPLARASDRVEPPGSMALDYGSPHAVLLTRTPAAVAGGVADVERRAGIRASLLAAAESAGDERLAGWLARRSLEWHVTDPDVWASVFAPGGGAAWWHAEGEHAAAVRRYVAAAMAAFAIPLGRELPVRGGQPAAGG